jgi:hypothetical protein
VPLSPIHPRTRALLFISISAATTAFGSLRLQKRSSMAGVASYIFVLVLIAIATTGTVRAQSFSPPDTYSTGDNPIRAAVADFNGDSKLDIAVTNSSSNTVSVLLNNSNGSFQSGVSYATDIWPVAVVTADLNQDGKMDLVTVNLLGGPLSDGSVSVLLGNGNGTFQAAVNYEVSSASDASNQADVSAVDLNGDGKLDLVVASSKANAASILLGNGNGTFQSAVTYPVGARPSGVAVADFNGDGKLDLALTSAFDDTTSILLGNGNGTFQTASGFSTGSYPARIIASDLNGDNKQDLVIGVANSNAVYVLFGNGNGTFQNAVIYPVGHGPANLALADLNGDGKVDIVVVNANGSTMSVLRGNGNGSFQPAVTTSVRLGSITLAVADLNTDGKPDLIIVDYVVDVVDVRLNSPSPHTVAINATAGTPATVLVGTFIDYDASKTACSFTASINWGDGSGATPGTVAANGSGGFNITGMHAYALSGPYSVSVQIADDSGNFATVISTATVSAAAPGDNAISATAGDGQSTLVNNPFTAQLQTTVAQSGVPQSGILVTFAAPPCGASGTFAGTGTATQSVVTDSNGVATTSVFTANAIGGSYLVTAIIGNGSPSTAFALTNNKADQFITFAGLPDKIFGDPDFSVSATASSGLTVSFAASGNCTVNVSTVHLTGAGSCTITASQNGNSTYNAALAVPQSFAIAKANQTITFGVLASRTFGDPDFSVSATASSGLGVSFGAAGNCTLVGTTVHITGAGSCTITASQAGDANYNAAPDVLRAFTIAKANQTISFGALSAKTFGDPDFSVSATASSGLGVSFGAAGNCTLAGATVHITGAGSCTITASQGGDANYNPAPDVPRAFTIAKANQTITFGALAARTYGDPDFSVSASATSGLSVSFGAAGNCTIAGATVHITGAGSCTLTASQAGDANYNAALDVPRVFTIAKASTTTTVTSTGSPTDFGQSVAFTATVTSGAGTPSGTVQFRDNGSTLGPAATLNASGIATLTTSSLATGTHTITADYAGNANLVASSGMLSGGQVVKIQPSLSINDVSITEGDSGTKTLNFTATLSAASTLTVSVNFATSNSSAIAPTDYAAITTTTLTFNPGETSRTIGVTINGDTTFESDERFFMNLSGAVNSTISDSLGIGSILNDDTMGGFISFSQADYPVSESAGSIVVTVQRTGNLAGVATVDYVTSADSGVPCATTTHVASPKCDFTSALGTLRFAVGESTKSFRVLISQDSFVEGFETFNLTLSNPTSGAALITPATATVTIADDVIEPSTNAIDEASNFVRQNYHDFLNREPDASGLAFWTDQITSCGSDQACIELRRINVSAAFFLSIEFQDTGYLVERLYKTSYGDVLGASTFGGAHQLLVPVVRFNEFLPDTQEIGQGVVVGQPGWEAALENKKQAFTLSFVQRARFATAFPTSRTPAQLVDELNANAGNVLSPIERATAIGLFGSATNTLNLAARAQALRQIAEDSDLNSAEFNRAFVLMEYFGYERRNPNDPQDTDHSGYDFWLTKLNQFNGNFVNAEMVKAFITSSEYRQHFGP